MEQAIGVAGQPSRNRLSGTVILVLLLVSFPLLALLVVEQGRVIDAQRLLIRQLSGDSQLLNAMRIRELQNRAQQAAPSAKTPPPDAQQQPGTQQKPSTQQQPGTAPQQKSRKGHESKQTPPTPPQEYPGSRPVPVRKAI